MAKTFFDFPVTESGFAGAIFSRLFSLALSVIRCPLCCEPRTTNWILDARWLMLDAGGKIKVKIIQSDLSDPLDKSDE